MGLNHTEKYDKSFQSESNYSIVLLTAMLFTNISPQHQPTMTHICIDIVQIHVFAYCHKIFINTNTKETY
jgi:hypothetical protein